MGPYLPADLDKEFRRLVRSEGRAQTRHASRYLAQICQHFAEHVPAEWDDRWGVAEFGWGRCALTATPDALLFYARAPDEPGLARVEYVIGEHAERFGVPESLSVSWLRVETGSPPGGGGPDQAEQRPANPPIMRR